MTYPTCFALLAVVATGCLGGSDDDCGLYDTRGASIAAYELRDPVSGVCQSYGGGGYCDPGCGPCPGFAEPEQPDWATCHSACEGLDETTCKGTPGCRAAYAGAAFHECWSVAPSGPVRGGDCTTLDAYACSRHDDCVARHATGSPIGAFQSCAPEGSAQDPGSCVGAAVCTMPPPTCPAGTIAGRRNGCWTGYCIPYAQCDQLPACGTLGEMECIGRTDCAPTYEGQNCTCTGGGCTCQSWTFDVCKDG